MLKPCCREQQKHTASDRATGHRCPVQQRGIAPRFLQAAAIRAKVAIASVENTSPATLPSAPVAPAKPITINPPRYLTTTLAGNIGYCAEKMAEDGGSGSEVRIALADQDWVNAAGR